MRPRNYSCKWVSVCLLNDTYSHRETAIVRTLHSPQLLTRSSIVIVRRGRSAWVTAALYNHLRLTPVWPVAWHSTVYCLRPNSITLSRSQTWFPTCRRQARAISTCLDSSNLYATCFRPKKGASWSQTRSQVCDQVGDLDSVMKFGLYNAYK